MCLIVFETKREKLTERFDNCQAESILFFKPFEFVRLFIPLTERRTKIETLSRSKVVVNS